jgi:hypothetical protein
MTVEFPDPGERADESSEAAIVRWQARLNLPRPMVLELIDDVLETFGQANPIGDDLLREFSSRHRQAWHILISTQSNQKDLAEAQMATRTMALVLGYKTAAGAEDKAALARKLGMDKQTVNKCAINFREKLGLPPEAGERCAAARANMKQARLKQLTNQTNHE